MVVNLLFIVGGLFLLLWFFANQVPPSELTTDRLRNGFGVLRFVISLVPLITVSAALLLLLLRSQAKKET